MASPADSPHDKLHLPVSPAILNVIEASGMALMQLSRDGRIVRFTPGMQAIYDVGGDDVGRPLIDVAHYSLSMPALPLPVESQSQRDGELVAGEELTAGAADIELPHNRWFRRRVFATDLDDGAAGWTMTFSDITPARIAEIRQQAEHEVAELLARAEKPEDVLVDILAVTRVSLHASVGLVWLMNDGRLRCTGTSIAPAATGAEEFVLHSQEEVFEIGEGLPGLAAETGDAHWIDDVPEHDWFTRARLAERCGLVTGIAMPIVSGKTCFGVMEFYSSLPMPRDRRLVGMLRAVGHQVGMSIRRYRADQSLRSEESRKSEILRNALDGIVTMDVQGRIVDFNPAAEKMFGWSAQEVRGQSLAETIIPLDFRDAHRSALSRYTQTGISTILGQRLELDAIRRSGQRFPVELSIDVGKNLDGTPFFTGYIRDISERKRQEMELRQSEAFLRRTLDSLFTFVGVCMPDGTLVQANRAALEVAGLEPDDVLGKPFWETYWWSYDPSVQQQLREAMAAAASGQSSRFDVDVRVGPGKLISIDCQLTPMRGEDGTITHLIPSGTDISDRKRLERDLIDKQSQLLRVLRESEADKAKLRVIFDQAWFYIGAIDLEGRLVDVNRTGLEACGYQRAEVIGKPFWKTAWWSGSPQVQQILKKAIEQAMQGESFRQELPYQFADGSEHIVDAVITPARNEAGEILFVIATGADVTEQKQADAREKREADRQAFLSEIGAALASSLDYENTLRQVTKQCVPQLADWAFLDLTSESDGQVRRLSVAHRDPEDAELAQRVALFPANPKWSDHPPARGLFGAQGFVIPEFTEEMLVKAAQNEQHERVMRQVAPRSFIVVPLVARGTIFGALTLISSTSGRRYTEDDLRFAEELAGRSAMAIDNARLFQRGMQASRAKSEFIANMSHEIRTPLTAVLGYADLLMANEQDAEKIKFLETIHRNGKFLLEILNDILDFSKIESGKLEIDKERFDVTEVVTDVYAMMAPRAHAKDLQIDVQYEGQLPAQIESDSKRLRQILVNLVGNAIKFTERGAITVTVREVGGAGAGSIEIEVRDTGIGIEQKQIERLFRPFGQGDSSVTRKFGGTGLGLAISQRLAGMLGGRVTVESTPGEGSVFTVRIAAGPLEHVVRKDPTRFTAESSPPIAPNETPRLDCRVLIVDDRRDVRFLAGHILSQHGATVHFSKDGLEACEFVENTLPDEKAPDLILLDMQMPRMDGYQAASRLRKIGFQKPIIALTADAMHGDMTRCLQSGCDDYLSKPIDSAELLRLVAKLTER